MTLFLAILSLSVIVFGIGAFIFDTVRVRRQIKRQRIATERIRRHKEMERQYLLAMWEDKKGWRNLSFYNGPEQYRR